MPSNFVVNYPRTCTVGVGIMEDTFYSLCQQVSWSLNFGLLGYVLDLDEFIGLIFQIGIAPMARSRWLT